MLGQKELAHALWPLGEMTKPQVRELAAHFNLSVAEKVESQDLCFLANGDYRDFLDAARARRVDPSRRDSRHSPAKCWASISGLPFYTIGQRKGIGLAASEPLYVIALDAADNAVIVGPQA